MCTSSPSAELVSERQLQTLPKNRATVLKSPQNDLHAPNNLWRRILRRPPRTCLVSVSAQQPRSPPTRKRITNWKVDFFTSQGASTPNRKTVGPFCYRTMVSTRRGGGSGGSEALKLGAWQSGLVDHDDQHRRFLSQCMAVVRYWIEYGLFYYCCECGPCNNSWCFWVVISKTKVLFFAVFLPSLDDYPAYGSISFQLCIC